MDIGASCNSERLVTRGWPRNNVSPLCRREYKTTRHLLAACRYTKRVWSLIATWIAWPQLNPNCWQTTFSASDRGRMMATTAGVLQRRCDMYFNWLFEKSRRNTMQERSREKSYKWKVCSLGYLQSFPLYNSPQTYYLLYFTISLQKIPPITPLQPFLSYLFPLYTITH